MPALAEALAAGVALALRYNPLLSFIGPPVAAALAVRSPRRHSFLGVPGLALMAAWVIGDGVRVAGQARALGEGGGSVAGALAVAVWALGGFAAGYALPAWAGAFVGRRVTHGTGWLSAVSISLVAAGAVAAVAGRLAG
ncbi:MAG: hypothetical protein IBX62_07805 [Coriobacteriia bacterium]|nr:hypothetical protein [Coriobacteriia bacterium]